MNICFLWINFGVPKETIANNKKPARGAAAEFARQKKRAAKGKQKEGERARKKQKRCEVTEPGQIELRLELGRDGLAKSLRALADQVNSILTLVKFLQNLVRSLLTEETMTYVAHSCVFFS